MLFATTQRSDAEAAVAKARLKRERVSTRARATSRRPRTRRRPAWPSCTMSRATKVDGSTSATRAVTLAVRRGDLGPPPRPHPSERATEQGGDLVDPEAAALQGDLLVAPVPRFAEHTRR